MPIRMEPKAADRQVAAVTAASGMPAGRQDGRVDQHDVGHGQKGGDPGQNLGAPVGSQAREFKIGFEALEHRWVLLEDHTAAAMQSDLCDIGCGERLIQSFAFPPL